MKNSSTKAILKQFLNFFLDDENAKRGLEQLANNITSEDFIQWLRTVLPGVISKHADVLRPYLFQSEMLNQIYLEASEKAQEMENMQGTDILRRNYEKIADASYFLRLVMQDFERSQRQKNLDLGNQSVDFDSR